MYYASACNDPDYNFPVGHTLIWEMILKGKELDLELLEMGPMYYGEENQKLKHICNFKRGFGGFPLPRYNARKRIL